jgi:hypothetical protein
MHPDHAAGAIKPHRRTHQDHDRIQAALTRLGIRGFKPEAQEMGDPNPT